MAWSISACSAALAAASVSLLWSASSLSAATPRRAARAALAALRSPPLLSISATSSVVIALTTPLALAGARNTSGRVMAVWEPVAGSLRNASVPTSTVTAPWPASV